MKAQSLVLAICSIVLFSACDQPCPECPECSEKSIDEAIDLSYDGWFFTGDTSDYYRPGREAVESLIVFSPLYPTDGSFLRYGSRFIRGNGNETYNLCNDFESNSGDGTSQVFLRVGKYSSRNVLEFESSPNIKLGGTDRVNNPVCVEWYIDKNKNLMFRVGTVNKAIDTGADFKLQFDGNGSIKLSGSFPIGLGNAVPALIGADDARGGDFTKDKLISYSLDPKLKSYASLMYVSDNATGGNLFVNFVENTAVVDTKSNLVGVSDWKCE